MRRVVCDGGKLGGGRTSSYRQRGGSEVSVDIPSQRFIHSFKRNKMRSAAMLMCFSNIDHPLCRSNVYFLASAAFWNQVMMQPVGVDWLIRLFSGSSASQFRIKFVRQCYHIRGMRGTIGRNSDVYAIFRVCTKISQISLTSTYPVHRAMKTAS